MKFHPQAAGDRKAFPLGLSVLWQHQQQRLVGTCTNWLNHGLMEPWWLLVFNSVSHRVTWPPLWAFRATCDAAGVVPKEGVQIPLRPLKLRGTWWLSPAMKLVAELIAGWWTNLAEAYRRYLFKHIWSLDLEEQYLYIYEQLWKP